MQKYNGWTNWDTWNANLWLNNHEVAYKAFINELTLEKPRLEDLFLRLRNEIKDFATDAITLSKINWQEIEEINKRDLITN